ncbi:MAG: hypothetical protein CSA76_03155 [Spirochaetales bacterium]|nr:MAG: hypothetical protein CSA76_03155 [Spirochaetales bacterium]
MSYDIREDAVKLYEEGRYASALELFLSEKADPAEDGELAYYMALCHSRLGEREDALRLLFQVLSSEENLARMYQARMLIVWLQVEEGELQQAEKNAREVLQEGFLSPQAWSALGYCQWRQGRGDLAMDSYREAVKLDDNNANAANGLGYLLAESGENLDEAVELCRMAVEENPENASYMDSLGWALFRSGNIPDAVRYLTEALLLRPDDAVIKEHLEAVRIHGKPEIL